MTVTKLTSFSPGAGCGCKLSPLQLESILKSSVPKFDCAKLIVGLETKDDAAVYLRPDGSGIISTTDFFTPIVDDPTDFGRVAATNAISDVYAMGGEPLMAVAILGWPIDEIPEEDARKVIDGGRIACNLAKIPLCGGHSINSPVPIFGLAVTGIVSVDNIKRNSSAEPGCLLYLTKPLGIGLLTTAEKKGLIKPEDVGVAVSSMCQLNSLGFELGQHPMVRAITDVTGFGFLGHLIEMCEASGVVGHVHREAVPRFANISHYINLGCAPGGTKRNFESYKQKIKGPVSNFDISLFCDPQTSGGLLVAVDGGYRHEIEEVFAAKGHGNLVPIGFLAEREEKSHWVELE